MPVNDDLRAIAKRILAWSSNDRNDFYRVGFMVCGIEDELRAALAAPQPDDLRAIVSDIASSDWLTASDCFELQRRAREAVAGSATPTEEGT
jgi:hypothetical protein